MDELLKGLVKAEYLPLFALVVLAIKVLIVPLVKELLPSTALNGTTSVKIALASSVVLAFLFRLIAGGSWSGCDIGSTLLVGVLAGMSAIGLNVTTAAARGKDVSISK